MSTIGAWVIAPRLVTRGRRMGTRMARVSRPRMVRVSARRSGIDIVPLLQAEPRLQLARRQQLHVDVRADVEGLRAGERSDHDGIEARVLHEARRDAQGLLVVAGDGDADQISLPVRLAAQISITDRVEGANEADAGKELRRRN